MAVIFGTAGDNNALYGTFDDGQIYGISGNDRIDSFFADCPV